MEGDADESSNDVLETRSTRPSVISAAFKERDVHNVVM